MSSVLQRSIVLCRDTLVLSCDDAITFLEELTYCACELDPPLKLRGWITLKLALGQSDNEILLFANPPRSDNEA